MSAIIRRSPLLVAAVVVMVCTGLAGAQVTGTRPGGRRPIVIPPLPTYNPNYYLPNGMTVSQYAYNVATIGRAYSQVPPYLFGYNPYPSPVVNYGGRYTPYYSPYAPAFVPLSPAAYPVLPGVGFPNFYTNPFFSFLNPVP
jgi:hypothetical protein